MSNEQMGENGGFAEIIYKGLVNCSFVTTSPPYPLSAPCPRNSAMTQAWNTRKHFLIPVTLPSNPIPQRPQCRVECRRNPQDNRALLPLSACPRVSVEILRIFVVGAASLYLAATSLWNPNKGTLTKRHTVRHLPKVQNYPQVWLIWRESAST